MLTVLLFLTQLLDPVCDCTKLPEEEKLLFSITRNLNNDRIVYVINTDQYGKIIEEDPVSICWIYERHVMAIENVPYFKKKFGYGVEVLNQGDTKVSFKFVSYDGLTFEIKRNKSGKYRVFVMLEETKMEINDIFVNIDGGTFWKPNVTQVMINGYEYHSNESISLPLFY
jgi:hypothetical protein